MSAPVYHVRLYAAAASTFGFGNLLYDFADAKNIGWANYLNDVPQAFFTLNQDRSNINALRAYEGTAHVEITRNGETVWRGILGEHDATDEDVVFYAYGYAGVLYWLATDWNTRWAEDTEVGTIIGDLWTRAKTTLTDSQLSWVTTGTIQSPVTTSGGSTALTLPPYRVYRKRILFAIKELIALSISDTTNTVYFEFAHSAAPATKTVTFNVWKNKSTDQTGIKWEYPNGKVRTFRELFTPVANRNVLYGVGSGPDTEVLQSTQDTTAGTYGRTAFGRKEDSIFLSWVRDQDETDRVTKLRAARALRPVSDLQLTFKANAVAPGGVSTSGWALGDRVKVKVKRGITQIDQYMQVVGQAVLFTRKAEYVRAFVMDRSGS